MADKHLKQQGDIPEFHRLTGEAIRAWADLEDQIWWFVAAILGIDQFRARIVVSSIPGSRAKREFVSRLAETYLDPALLPKFRSFLDRMKRLGRTRNLLAHAPMHVNVDGKENLAFSDVFSEEMDGGLDFEAKPIPLNDLRTLVQALETLRGELVMFLVECDGHIYKDARIHREEAARRASQATSKDGP